MTLGGYGDSVQDAKLRGASDLEASLLGAAQSAAEYATEKIPLENFFEAFDAVGSGTADVAKGAVDFLKKAFFSEALGEGASAALSTAADEIIMGEMSKRQQAIANIDSSQGDYQSQVRKINLDTVREIFYEALAGGLDGMVSTGSAYATGSAMNTINRNAQNLQAQSVYLQTVTALSQALTTTDQQSQVSTIAAALMNEGTPEEASAASTAAMSLMAKSDGETVIRTLRDVLTIAQARGIAKTDVAQAMRMAALEGTESAAALEAVTQEPTPENVAAFVEAAKRDTENPDVQAQQESAAMESEIIESEKALIAEGALDGLSAYQANVDKAADDVQAAKLQAQDAQKRVDTIAQDLQTVQSQFLANTQNMGLYGLLQQRVKDLKGAAIVRDQMIQHQSNAEERLNAAQQKLDTERDSAMQKLREQAMEMASQKRQEAEAERQQQNGEPASPSDVDPGTKPGGAEGESEARSNDILPDGTLDVNPNSGLTLSSQQEVGEQQGAEEAQSNATVEDAKKQLSRKEMAMFYEKIAEIKIGKGSQFSDAANGGKILAIDNKLVYTNGNWDDPSIDTVLTIHSENESDIDSIRSLIYDAEAGKTNWDTAWTVVESVFGEGILTGGDTRAVQAGERSPGGGAQRQSGGDSQGTGRGISNSVPAATAVADVGLATADAGTLPPPNNTLPPNQPNPTREPRLKERQFAARTAQDSEAVPVWLKRELLSNHDLHYYEADSNYEQLERSWGRMNTEGYEGMRDRLLSTPDTIMSADDVADANLLMAMAFRNGDMQTAFDVAAYYDVQGTKQGQALQARAMLKRMTPNGMRAKTAGQYEQQLADYLDTHKQKTRQMDERANKVADSIKRLANFAR